MDDEQSLLEVCDEMLNALGYRVTCATDGEAALALFQQHPSQFDVVITDMSMPEMTGNQLAQKIIQLSPNCPVILCTGYSQRIDENKLSDLGIRELLFKPFSQAQIAQAIRRVLKPLSA